MRFCRIRTLEGGDSPLEAIHHLALDQVMRHPLASRGGLMDNLVKFLQAVHDGGDIRQAAVTLSEAGFSADLRGELADDVDNRDSHELEELISELRQSLAAEEVRERQRLAERLDKTGTDD